jgi:hypothetical protein
MESIIDTNGSSPQRRRLKKTDWAAGLGEIFGLGKREIISGTGRQGQVSVARFINYFFTVSLLIGGCNRTESTALKQTRVVGASMSPTIWGEHVAVHCDHCGRQWRANWQPEMRPARDPICGNCGGTVPLESVESQPGDEINIDTGAFLQADPTLDDVVAIRSGNQVRIKRIVGTPGHVISVYDGYLVRDECPISTSAPWMLVHDDTHRRDGESWWTFRESELVEQLERGFKFEVPPRTASPVTLVYQHRSPYQSLKPDEVRDDYPGNLVESRFLRSVKSLQVKASCVVREEAMLEWWRWSPSGLAFESQSLSAGHHEIEVRWMNEEVSSGSPEQAREIDLAAEKPIGLVVTQGTLTLSDLVILRPIVYWIDPKATDVSFPLQLEPTQYFVVGDNVPLSIDSRHTGPIRRSDIIGKVRPTDSLNGGGPTRW